MKPFLELFEGCYGLQRNGDTVGPLRQDKFTGTIIADRQTWYPTGLVSSTSETPLDIIEIIPAPEKLPEPFECVGRFTGGLFYDMHSDLGGGTLTRHSRSDNVNSIEYYRCTVTPIERLK